MGSIVNFNTNGIMDIIQNRSTKIAQEIGKGLGITDIKTILQIKADVAGELTMNPERLDEDVAFDLCFMPQGCN